MKRTDAIGLAAVVTAAAAAYLWRLDLNGWGNGYYAAAAQAGAQDWKAFFFGSLDSGNSITIDKLPASIWLTAISVRLFGLSSWSLLVPHALLGAGTVALTYATVRRHFRHSSAMIASVVVLLTPAAAVMFRYNNPDALLVFLLTLATYLMVRASDDGRWRWVVGAGAVIGVGFLAKSAQALLLLPALAGVYLYAGPGPLKRRLAQLVAGMAAVVAMAMWWILIAQATPPDERPYAGGSFTNSFVEVLLRQNGLGRILGEAGGGTPGQSAAPPGPLRLIQYSSFGSQGAWLLPAAILLLLATLVYLRHQQRLDPRRATLLFAGGWLLCYAAVFSFMGGVIHPYYLIALAPPIAIIVGGTWEILRPAQRWLPYRIVLSLAVLASGIIAFGYLTKSSALGPAFAMAVVAFCVISCELVVFRIRHRIARRSAACFIAATCGLGPLLLSASAIASPHTGVSPAASMIGSPAILDSPDPSLWPPGNSQRIRGSALGHPAEEEVVDFLHNAANPETRWAAASPGALNAAEYQLNLELPVMPVAGFNGGTPYPTISQFSEYIESGQIRYYVVRHDSQDIEPEAEFADDVTDWVRANFVPEQIGAMDVFDLRQRLPKS
ncbi:ArnT family glycosyltransferase [Pseudarthrobacter sp. YS3]|uniref:ArnT family glycosyltransferase n=1 Tax=Pseudarthrobacter sp. YS3 TaxID=3453718 RepID=UPI003EEDF620